MLNTENFACSQYRTDGNALFVAVTESLFLKNASITKPRCSPDQLVVFTNN